MTFTPPRDDPQWDGPRVQIEQFVRRFDPSYKKLLQHAALPLVLTPELVNYLRNEFLRGEGVPWIAEVDLLLSDLCSQVGYELYAMDTEVRAYLLNEVKDDPVWQRRMQEVARVLISYVNHLSRTNPERQQEIKAQRLAAMVYLGGEDCRKAAQEIAERFRESYRSLQRGTGHASGIQAELAQLSRITQELAPGLTESASLVQFAGLVQQVLRDPYRASVADLRRDYRVGDVVLSVPERVLPESVKQQLRESQGVSVSAPAAAVAVDEAAALPGFPALQVLEFESVKLVAAPGQLPGIPPLQTQQFEVVTVELEDETEGLELQPVEFTVATIERRDTEQKGFLQRLFQRGEQQGDWVIWRQQRRGQQWVEDLGNGVELEMMLIPAGRFLMGSPMGEEGRSPDEGSQHNVSVPSLLMGKYPVTQEQWKAIALLPKVERDLEPNPSYFEGDRRPVEQVSWEDAVEFCARLSQLTEREYRLPSEAEWEYACRAGTQTPFHFGETITERLANYQAGTSYNGGPNGKSSSGTTPIGQFNANSFGLYDMHGNVFEWCLDYWHDNYEDAPDDGSAWVESGQSNRRVLRGGSWFGDPPYCRSAFRIRLSPGSRIFDLGFRVVCALPRTN